MISVGDGVPARESIQVHSLLAETDTDEALHALVGDLYLEVVDSCNGSKSYSLSGLD